MSSWIIIYAHRIQKYSKACHVFEALDCPKSHEDVILNLYTYAILMVFKSVRWFLFITCFRDLCVTQTERKHFISLKTYDSHVQLPSANLVLCVHCSSIVCDYVHAEVLYSFYNDRG